MHKRKLISFENGGFQLNVSALTKLQKQIKYVKDDTPVAILAVTGPPKSGKSFYTNLIIEYLSTKSCEWLTKFSRHNRISKNPLQGFSFGNVNNSQNIVFSNDESGIYAWWKLFTLKQYDETVAICVLHLHLRQSDEQNQPVVNNAFSYLLTMLSSRVIHISRQTDKVLAAALKPTTVIDLPKQIQDKLSPKNKLVLLRSTLDEGDVNNIPQEFLENLKTQFISVEVAWIPESKTGLHNEMGKLELSKVLHVQIDKTIRQICDVNSISPKYDGKDLVVKVSDMQSLFLNCIKLVNSHLNKYQTQQQQPIETKEIQNNPKGLSHENREVGTEVRVTRSQRYNAQNQLEFEEQASQAHAASLCELTEEDLDARKTQISISNSKHYNLTKSETECKNDLRNTYEQEIMNNGTVFKKYDQHVGDNQPVVYESKHQDTREDRYTNVVDNQEKEYAYPANDGEHKVIQGESTPKNEEARNSHNNMLATNKVEGVQAVLEHFDDKEQAGIGEEEMRGNTGEFSEGDSGFVNKNQYTKNELESEENDETNWVIITQSVQTQLANFIEETRIGLEELMIHHLENWLNNSCLTPDITYCQSIFRICLNEILVEKSSHTPKMQNLHIRTSLKNNCAEIISQFHSIHENIMRFHTAIERLMSLNVCVLHEQLAFEINQNSCIDIRETQAKHYIESGFSKLGQIYILQNQKIIDCEEYLLSKIYEKIVMAYKTEMEQNLTSEPCNPTTLTFQHRALLGSIENKLHSLQPLCSSSKISRSFIQANMENKLKMIITKMYTEYRRINIEKLRMFFACIKPIILKYKTEYCNELGNIMKQSNKQISEDVIQKQNQNLQDVVKGRLETEIQMKFGNAEPTVGYWTTLKYEIDELWKTFQDINSKKPCVADSCQITESESPLQQQLLPPLILQLSLSRVSAFISHESELISLGQYSTTIGETSDSILLCESEFIEHGEVPKFERTWNLCQFLLSTSRSKSKEEVVVNGKPHILTTELLLGLLFHSVKQKSEAHLQGRVRRCVVTIPCWLTSIQRQQVKDSGKVAGFVETDLINENSAIALCLSRMMTSSNEEKNDIVVLSENSNWVDATIYSYEKSHSGVKTTGHCGSYELKNLSDSNFSKIYETYKSAQKISDEKYWYGSRAKIVAISFQSEEYRQLLIDVGTQIATDKTIRGSQDAMVPLGAFHFSQNPMAKRFILQDWLSSSIYRKVGSKTEVMVQSKIKCSLPLQSPIRHISSSFYATDEWVYFFQNDVNQQRSCFGGLKLETKSKEWVEINLDVSSESIVTLYLGQSWRKNVRLCDAKLDDNQLMVYASLLEDFKKRAVEVLDRDKKKSELIYMGNMLLQKAQTVLFKSDLAKNMAISQIQESLTLLNHPKITASDIQKQLELFKRYEEKFKTLN